MIDEVMYEIRELTGQAYVNTYAGEKAETEPTVAGTGRERHGRATRFDSPIARTRSSASSPLVAGS